jgi:hypothetical protein
MQRIWIGAALLGLSGCLGANLGSSSSGGAGGGATSDGGTAQGVNCGADPNTGATLCLGLSLCPNLVVDQSTYPACGFRVRGNALDVECSCGGELCPLGAATSCDAVLKLLQQQSEGIVCAQVSAGTCESTGPGAGSSSSSSGSSTCDKGCRDLCAGEPSCITGCGC